VKAKLPLTHWYLLQNLPNIKNYSDGTVFTINSKTSEKKSTEKEELKAEEINQAKMM